MAKNVAAVEGAIGKLNTNINSLTRAILESVLASVAPVLNLAGQSQLLNRWVTNWQFWKNNRKVAPEVLLFLLPSFVPVPTPRKQRKRPSPI
jgi:hypothetical protein